MPGLPEDLRSMLCASLADITKSLKCDSGSIQLYDSNTGTLNLTEIIGPEGDATSKIQPLDRGIAGWVASHREHALVEDISTDNRFTALRNSKRSYKTNSFVSVPILAQNDLVGVVNVADKHDGAAFGSTDLQLLQELARNLADSIRTGSACPELKHPKPSFSEKVQHAARQLANANHQLAQMQVFHDSVLRSISLGIVTFAPDFRITSMNREAQSILGFAYEEAGTGNVLELPLEVPPSRNWSKLLCKCAAEGEHFTLRKARYITPAGRERLLDIICAPVDFATGVDGGTFVVEDVGQRIEFERRMAQAEQLATVGKLAASVVHELNNPLDGVLRFTNMALHIEDIDPRVHGYLEECRNGLERLARIVRSLLDYSRSVGKLPEQQDVNKLLREAIERLNTLQARSKVTVSTSLADDLPMVRLSNFHEVFTHIVRNAYEAMPNGGELAVTTRTQGNDIEVIIADSGPGIPPELAQRVFEAFFTTRKAAHNTGLGLAICRDIVSKHGGTIEMEIAEGNGATFIVRVPL